MSMTWRQVNRLIFSNAKKKKIPVAATFELTARCNFHCRMCYLCRYPDDREAMKRELTAEQWIKVAQEARDEGVLFVTLTGGEIFLRKDFREIYEAFANMGFNITLYTNGSMITEETAEWLGKIPPSKVSITVYGASPETYEIITGHRDGFERTLRGIRALKANKIYTETKTTVIKANQDEFDEMIKLAESLDVGLGVVNYVAPRREDCITDPLANRLDPMETALYEQRFEEYNYNVYMQQKELKATINKDDMYEDSVSELGSDDEYTTGNSAFRCSAGKYAFWVSWDGKMTPCGLLPTPALDILDKPIKELWEELKTKCSEIPKCGECKDCNIKEACMACPARLYSETGGFEKKAPYLCDTAQCRIDLKIRHKYQDRGR